MSQLFNVNRTTMAGFTLIVQVCWTSYQQKNLSNDSQALLWLEFSNVGCKESWPQAGSCSMCIMIHLHYQLMLSSSVLALTSSISPLWSLPSYMVAIKRSSGPYSVPTATSLLAPCECYNYRDEISFILSFSGSFVAVAVVIVLLTNFSILGA